MGPLDPLPPEPTPSGPNWLLIITLVLVAASTLKVSPGKDMVRGYLKTWGQAFLVAGSFLPAYLPIAGLGGAGLILLAPIAIVFSVLGLTWRWLGEPVKGKFRFEIQLATIRAKAKREQRKNPSTSNVLVAGSAGYVTQAQATPGQIASLPPSATGFYQVVARDGVTTLEPA